jgi:hypothetical protein
MTGNVHFLPKLVESCGRSLLLLWCRNNTNLKYCRINCSFNNNRRIPYWIIKKSIIISQLLFWQEPNCDLLYVESVATNGVVLLKAVTVYKKDSWYNQAWIFNQFLQIVTEFLMGQIADDTDANHEIFHIGRKAAEIKTHFRQNINLELKAALTCLVHVSLMQQ